MFDYILLKSEIRLFLILIALLLFNTPLSFAISNTKDIKEVGIEEKLGESIDTDLEFINQQGESVKLGSYF